MKNGFFIRKTRKNEIARVMEIYEIGRAYMRETGNTDQWANGYPNEETVKDDIEKGFSYVVADTADMPVGVFAFIPADDPTYKKIYDGNWLNDAPYCTIHRIAVAVRKQGIASFVFKWAAQHCDNVRADTHCANFPMQNALVKAGFKYCGIIYLQNGDERLAYQKVVDYESENRIKIPKELIEYADALTEKTALRFPALAPLAARCYLNTIETTVRKCENGDYFVITGDIPAMWLRDSAAQLRPYMPICKKSSELCDIIKGVIRRHAFYVNLDPYSNAFNEISNPESHRDKTDFSSDYIWERKYEVDSLCASVYLASDYYETTGDTSIFTESLREMLIKITDTFMTEQSHAENSEYYFTRDTSCDSDTLPNNGKGNPVSYTGMTWSGFRPSDDCCMFNFLIPSEMMCVVAMKKAAALLKNGYNDTENAEKCLSLAEEVDKGIKEYGVINHPRYGKMYCYETDGKGDLNLMDDANSPSLLAAPYIGYCDKTDPVYLNTRRFVLSEDNPWYFEGKAAKGIGSPHTGSDTIWHISIIMQILTSTDNDEIERCLEMLRDTHAGTYFMHESFNKDDASDYTRSWFAWANALFAQMLGSL